MHVVAPEERLVVVRIQSLKEMIGFNILKGDDSDKVSFARNLRGGIWR